MLKALHAPLAWALVVLANPQPGEVVLDPVCGRGGLLIEGALEFGEKGVHFIGADKDEKQVQACKGNLSGAAAYFDQQGGQHESVKTRNVSHQPTTLPPKSPFSETARDDNKAVANAAASSVSLLSVQVLQADARHLPLETGSVDCVVMDLPFGKKHGKQLSLCGLVLAEAARVLKPSFGRCVVFTTSRQEVYGAVVGDSRWSPVSRTEVLFSGLRAWIHLLTRTEIKAD